MPVDGCVAAGAAAGRRAGAGIEDTGWSVCRRTPPRPSERATEEGALAAAVKALAEQEAVRLGDERNYQKVLDRLQPFKDKVDLHKRNIEALRREISGLR